MFNKLEEENLDYLDVPCVYGNCCSPSCSGSAPPVDGIDAVVNPMINATADEVTLIVVAIEI